MKREDHELKNCLVFKNRWFFLSLFVFRDLSLFDFQDWLSFEAIFHHLVNTICFKISEPPFLPFCTLLAFLIGRKMRLKADIIISSCVSIQK